MPVPKTVPEFLALVRQSGVVAEPLLERFLKEQGTAVSDTARPGALAGLLMQAGLLTHFQADQLLQGKWRRFSIGRYRVLEQIGSGGFGSVYLCEHLHMRRKVAVKVLPLVQAKDATSLQRFYREARAVAALNHPNIVRAYDVGQEENLHFLAMEYVDGVTLHDLVAWRGPLEPLQTVQYLRQAALGLQHAYAAGLVHRDIKPGNLLVDLSGTLKILDLGLARFYEDHTDQLSAKNAQIVLGTVDYVSPEQALNSHDVDIRSDIYSLGATFYFCLTGSPPFPKGTAQQKLVWHQTRMPRPLAQLRKDVPAELSALIETAMAKDPNQRFQTPLELLQALDVLPLLSGETATNCGAETFTKRKKRGQRHWLIAAVAAAFTRFARLASGGGGDQARSAAFENEADATADEVTDRDR
jgi:serine/threonine protein kinase